MHKQLFVLLGFLICTTFVLGQTKPKSPAKNTTSELNKLLSATGLPFTMANDSLGVIPYEGANIANYQVLVQKVSDLYIVYTNLTETLPTKIYDAKFKYLLQQNDHFDIVKVGLNTDENIFYLRADIYKTGTNPILLKRIITQVGNVTNIIAGELK